MQSSMLTMLPLHFLPLSHVAFQPYQIHQLQILFSHLLHYILTRRHPLEDRFGRDYFNLSKMRTTINDLSAKLQVLSQRNDLGQTSLARYS